MATTVPELLAKKRKRDEQWAAAKAAAAVEARKKASDTRKAIFKRAEAYVKEYRAQVGAGAPGIGLRAAPINSPPHRRAAPRRRRT
jgi:hypothetical protein